MGLSRIDTWLCRKWCIACESAWTAFKGRELYPATYTGDVAGDKSAPPEVIAEMQDDLKHGNTYYTGVETDKGGAAVQQGHSRRDTI